MFLAGLASAALLRDVSCRIGFRCIVAAMFLAGIGLRCIVAAIMNLLGLIQTNTKRAD
jgi:hypothetical protein